MAYSTAAANTNPDDADEDPPLTEQHHRQFPQGWHWCLRLARELGLRLMHANVGILL